MSIQYICDRCGGIIPPDTIIENGREQIITPVKFKEGRVSIHTKAYEAEAHGPVLRHFCLPCLVVLIHDDEKKESQG